MRKAFAPPCEPVIECSNVAFGQTCDEQPHGELFNLMFPEVFSELLWLDPLIFFYIAGTFPAFLDECPTGKEVISSQLC